MNSKDDKERFSREMTPEPSVDWGPEPQQEEQSQAQLQPMLQSGNEPAIAGGEPATADGEQKLTKKEFVLREARAVVFMILYLVISLSLLATFRCLVLIQHGINDFMHSYVVAVVLAIALGKIVVICQKLPAVNALNQRPLIWSVLYKAIVMTLIANLGSKAEEHLFPALHAPTGSTEHQMILLFTRQLALFFVFVVLFTWRDLDRALGHGTLFKLFFLPRKLALKDLRTGECH